MKILAIARTFPPENTASGQLVIDILEKFPDNFEVHLLSVDHTDYSGKFTIHKLSNNQKRGFLIKKIKRIQRNLSNVPYDSLTLNKTSKFIEKLVTEHCFDKVIAFTPNEIIALHYANINNDKKNCLFFEKLFNDQTINIPRFRKNKDQINMQLYKKIIDSFNGVACFPIVYKFFERYNLINDTKIIKVEQPFIPQIIEQHKFDYNIFLYAGGLDNKQRNPKELIRILKLIMNSHDQAVWYGGGNAFSKIKRIAKIDDRFIYNGFFSIESKIEILRQSTVLLSIGNIDIEVMPSKVLELISYGVPIIHYAFSTQDPAIEYLAKYPKAMIVGLEGSNHSNFSQRIENIVEVRVTEYELEDIYRDHLFDTVIQKLMKMLTNNQ